MVDPLQMLASCFQPRLGAIVRPRKISHPSTRPVKKKKKFKKKKRRPSEAFFKEISIMFATHKLSIAPLDNNKIFPCKKKRLT